MGHTACTEPQCLYKGALYLYHFYIALLITVYIYLILTEAYALFSHFPLYGYFRKKS